MDKTRLFNEGGINWCWYTELIHHNDNTVTINRHYRLHRYDDAQGAAHHPIAEPQQWGDAYREGNDRIALEYHIPEIGFCKIRNPKYIFAYE